jgi:acyl-CoA synthetase (AMP-forming)/AMP-acid ligase II
MQETMMHYPLTLSHRLERAGKFFSKTEIVSRRPAHTLHRFTYADLDWRARALAEALRKARLERGDRVATLGRGEDQHWATKWPVSSLGAMLIAAVRGNRNLHVLQH